MSDKMCASIIIVAGIVTVFIIIGMGFYQYHYGGIQIDNWEGFENGSYKSPTPEGEKGEHEP